MLRVFQELRVTLLTPISISQTGLGNTAQPPPLELLNRGFQEVCIPTVWTCVLTVLTLLSCTRDIFHDESCEVREEQPPTNPIKTIASGETNRQRIDAAESHGGDAARTDPSYTCLTSRQIEVLRLVAIGFSSKEIAEKLYVTVKSVDCHKYKLMQKLDLHDRVHLCRYAIRQGLIEP